MLVLTGGISMEEKLVKILNEMAEYLSISQMKKLQEVLLKNMKEQEDSLSEATNYDYLEMFIAAKKIEGCSARTVAYYEATVKHLLKCIDTPIRKITTDEIRSYLAKYQEKSGCSKTTVDNIRRNISSFFSWLEEEDYILKSPMKRIHKIKTVQPVKETISDELIERLRDACLCKRDLAMVDLLYSTGIRVGELVRLNVDDISFEVKDGEILAIVGFSGSGKSTVLKLITGLIEPTSGEIKFDTPGEVAMVFQYSALFDSLNVFDNITFALQERKEFRGKNQTVSGIKELLVCQVLCKPHDQGRCS